MKQLEEILEEDLVNCTEEMTGTQKALLVEKVLTSILCASLHSPASLAARWGPMACEGADMCLSVLQRQYASHSYEAEECIELCTTKK